MLRASTQAFLLSTAAVSTSLGAQELRRVPVPETQTPTQTQAQAQAAPAKVRSTILPRPRLLHERAGGAALDDVPDFAPTEEVESADGRHVSVRQKGNPYTLAFVGGSFAPQPGIDPAMRARQAQAPAGHTHGYVMIRGRMSAAKMQALRDLGVVLLDRHTWQSVVARIPLARLQDIARLGFVHWVGYAQPQQKLGARLARRLENAADGAVLDVYVNLFEADAGGEPTVSWIGEHKVVGTHAVASPIRKVMPNGKTQRALEELGFAPTFYDHDVFTFRGRATVAQVRAMQKLDFVRTLELYEQHHGFHDQAMTMIGQDRVRKTWPGTRVPVGYIDSGIDTTPLHQDFSSKHFHGWRATSSLPNTFQDGHGHGTHVAGTIFGRGLADQRYTGAAPAVGMAGWDDVIFVGRYLDDNNSGQGDVKNLYEVFRKSQVTNGKSSPRRAVVNNSWGSRNSSGYNGTESNSRTIDDIVWNYNQTYVFSAGNKGSTANWWAGSPGCAKNVLTVGAVTDRWDGSNVPGRAASFTRFNTTDGRRKPEITAPGDALTSCRINTTTDYRNMSGTSMSAPTVTGAVASLMDRDSLFKYRPAVVKASLVASATNDGGLSPSGPRGYGLIDSYKLNKAGTTSYQVMYGTITKKGNWAYGDLKIAANVKAVRVVLAWIEPRASSLASSARRNDIRLYMDLPPYSSSGTSGEFSNASSRDNLVVRSSYVSTSTGFAKAAAGKTVRFKVHASSLSVLDDVRYALAVIQYYRTPSRVAPQPTFAVVPKVNALRPGQTLTVDTSIKAHSSADDFSNARIYFSSPTVWSMQTLSRSTADSLLHSYTSSNNHRSANFPLVQSGSSGGMTIGKGPQRSLQFTFKAPSTAMLYFLNFRATYDSGTSLAKAVPVCVDDKAPNPISNLKSSAHTVGQWSKNPKITLTWTKASDNGCAGLKRLHYEKTHGAPKTPNSGSPTQVPAQSWHYINAFSSKSGFWFSIRARDNVDYFGATSTIGPFYIDNVKPVASTPLINGNATHTSSLNVSVKFGGYDGHSGLQLYQYSLNGIYWSAWATLTGAAKSINLANFALGGHNQQGVHRVYVRVRDKAGNQSSVASSLITYLKAPTLTTATISSLPSVNAKYYRLVGTNLDLVKSISFAGKTITSKFQGNHDSAWANGYFRIFGSTVIWFYPPQGLTPGSYKVRVNNVVSTSNSLWLTVTANTQPILRSANTVLENGLQTLIVTRGNHPVGVTTIIMVSTSKLPSKLPGIYDFAIGNNFTNFVLLPEIGFNGLGHAKIGLPVINAMVGLTAHFQAGYLDKVTPTWPMPVSDVWTTKYVQ